MTHNNKEDIIMKRVMTIFAEQAVGYFGETKKVKDIAPTELVDIEIVEKRMDYVFLMDDDTYTHFEFQTTNKGITDLIRFNLYDSYLYQQEKRQVYTYVIYSGDIRNPLCGYQNGFSKYKVKTICMADKDGDKILKDIEDKLIAGKTLSNQETLDLIFAPIMGGKLSKEDRIVRGIKLSKNYKMEKWEDVQSVLFVFAHKFLDDDQLSRVKEVLKMTKLGEMLKEDGLKEGMEKGKIEMVKELLKEKLLSKEQIARASQLPLEKIEEIEQELMALK